MKECVERRLLWLWLWLWLWDVGCGVLMFEWMSGVGSTKTERMRKYPGMEDDPVSQASA